MTASTKKTVLETKWFSVEAEYFDSIESLNGEPYYRINSPDGVIILSLTDKGEIILVRQFRPAIKEHTLEFPSGYVEKNETPELTAARELYEETGYKCKEIKQIFSGRVMMNRNNSRNLCFVATGAVKDRTISSTSGLHLS